MTWLVRLGAKRGKGRYVSRLIAAYDIANMDRTVWSLPKQIDARRFELRELAEGFAKDYGGRVVKLRSAASVG